ncbi:MAG: hypothetical protein VYD64_10795 [Pseudomonadota bacterium]|nr:hypothetical protein [Pseudomonadota bacterium]
MLFRIPLPCALLPVAGLALFAAFVPGGEARAACPGLAESGVSMTGEVIEHIKGAAMLKIQTLDCGKITVGIPAESHEELALFFEECEIGAAAFINGRTVIGILEASELNCL